MAKWLKPSSPDKGRGPAAHFGKRPETLGRCSFPIAWIAGGLFGFWFLTGVTCTILKYSLGKAPDRIRTRKTERAEHST